MKRTVREKNSIIITSVFYSILVIVTLLFIVFNAVDKIKGINEKKVETQLLYNDRINIEKEGLSFEEFSLLSAGSKNDQEILENISKDFYDKHLKNNTKEPFDTFIKKKTTELNNEENTKLIMDNKKQLINILPTYSENNLDVGSNNLTDYQFINYVESIIETFNLSAAGSIGIGNIILLDDYAVSSTKGETLESSIYSIPLSTNIKGTKKNIIDFLYFIENVGTINIHNNEISIIRDNGILSTNGLPKVLAGDKYSKDYNIFENQIIDIEYISMVNYIDGSYNARGTKDFIDFIKDDQGNEDFEIKVSLNFYVKGQPKHEVLKFINSIISNFKLINIKVTRMISSGEVKGIELLKLKKQQNLLKNLNIKVINLSAELRKHKDLETVYKKAIEVSKFVIPMCEDLEGVCK